MHFRRRNNSEKKLVPHYEKQRMGEVEKSMIFSKFCRFSIFDEFSRILEILANL